MVGDNDKAGRLRRLTRRVLPPGRRESIRSTIDSRSSMAGHTTLDDLLRARVAGRSSVVTAGGSTVSGTTAPASEQPGDTHGLDPDSPPPSRFGRPGRGFDRRHPFYVGFMGGIGVLIAIGLVRVLGELTSTITLLIVSLFLALGLEPVVIWLSRRGVVRPLAIGVVFIAVIVLFVGFGATVAPIIVDQGTQLATTLPTYMAEIQRAPWFQELDGRYDLVGRLTTEVEARLSDGEFYASLFGGVLGAGQAVVGGVFNTFTVLVLTLYFLASMRTLRATGYALVPASRRERVQLLGDEISSRIGGYVIGQIAIATLNGVCSYLMMLILDIPYPAVLAIVVGLLGLIPLVGASLGAVVVVAVAMFVSLPTAAIVLVYYLIYQQLENYVIAPRVMSRTVSVPGAVAVVAALAGGSLLGILGALIAIPLAAGILLVIQEVLMPRQNRL